MTPFERHLQAARGYLDLGMSLEAHDELEEIAPEMRDLSEVFALKVKIFQRLEKWALVEAVAKELYRRHPDEPRWPLAMADAIRRDRSMQAGLEILVQAAMRFPAEARVFYTLASYQAQLGYLDAARGRLSDAIRLDPMYRVMADGDPTLQRLRGDIR